MINFLIVWSRERQELFKQVIQKIAREIKTDLNSLHIVYGIVKIFKMSQVFLDMYVKR